MKFDVLDQAGACPPTSAFVFDWNEGVPATARDIIRERIRNEYETTHGGASEGFANDLVQVSARVLRCTLDEALDRALRGFESNRLFLVVDGTQITGLDQPFLLTPTSKITFLRLIKLKGG